MRAVIVLRTVFPVHPHTSGKASPGGLLLPSGLFHAGAGGSFEVRLRSRRAIAVFPPQAYPVSALSDSSAYCTLSSCVWGWLGRPVGSGALCTSCRRLPAGDPSVPLRDQPGALIWRHLIFRDRARDGGLCVWRLDEADQFQRTLDVIDAPRRVLRLDQS